MGALDGKTAVVTGGGTGIGYAVAERFAHEGAQVLIVGRRKERLDDAVQRIGHGARSVAADVGDDAQVERLFGDLDHVDILATCAGTAIFGPVDQIAPQAWRDLFQGRFFGQLSCCHFAVPRMPTGGVILLCSGVAGLAGLANYSGGSALCGAVNAMGRALAVELAPRGIRVNVLSPGLISGTAAESNLAPEDRMNFLTKTLARIPMHRPGGAPDMAAAAFFLATCDYANGMVLNVDGGWTAS